MPVLSQAVPRVLHEIPGVRVLIAGPGDPDDVREKMTQETAAACEFLGPVSDQDKASLLASVDLYVAANTGGGGVGSILIQAKSGSATGVASGRPASHEGPTRGGDGGKDGNRGAAGPTARASDGCPVTTNLQGATAHCHSPCRP